MKGVFNNKIIFASYILVVFCLILGLSYAVNSGLSSNDLEGKIVYIDEDAYGNLNFDSNNFELTPVLDKTVAESNRYIIKLNFLVGGAKENNIDNMIYDISLTDLDLDCNLLSPYLKWKLVKNGEVISEGSLSREFDTIVDGRLVLTPIQQDLKEYSEDKSTYDEYYFYMWLSDSCQDEDLRNCKYAEDQRNLTNKRIKGKISVELNVGAKKELVRNPSETVNTVSCIKEVETDN